MSTFPTFPMSGKNSAIEISTNDGQLLTLAEMTLQSSYTYRGETYADVIYLLGTGKTLINIRPAMMPMVYIDGILQGLDLAPGAADKISVTAGQVEIAGTVYSIAADAELALENASSDSCWNAIVIDTSTQALGVIKGTDGATLLDTYGDSAGQRPLIPSTKILVGWAGVGTTPSTLVATDIDYQDREFGGVDYEILPNIGGVKLQTALAKVHAATIGGTPAARPVKFTGRYLDAVLSRIGTAKSWSMSPNTSDISDDTFGASYKQTEINGFGISFEQLAADKKVISSAFDRQGHCAIKLIMPNGFAWQSVATVAPTINSQVGSMINISVSGSLGDFPVEA